MKTFIVAAVAASIAYFTPAGYRDYQNNQLGTMLVKKYGCTDLGKPNGSGAIDAYVTRGYSCETFGTLIVISK